MAPALLSLQNVRFALGGKPLFEEANLSVAAGERLCLVGRNGSGKSTLLRMAAGELEPDAGTRFLQPMTSLRYLPQEPSMEGHDTVLDFVASGLGPTDDSRRAAYLLERLSLRGDVDPRHLSGGEARRAALARALAPEPDVLLLDEPTNHLDLFAIEWLEAELSATRSALVLVSHDRRFLETLSTATLWLDRGRTRRIERGFSAFEEWRDHVLEEEERDRHKLDRKIAAEENWVRYGVTARRKRNVRRMSRLAELRQQRRDARRAAGQIRLAASEATAAGAIVLEADRISKRFEGTSIVADFSIRIARDDRVGLLGPNGAGKTTLMNLLTGAMPPDSGAVRLGSNVALATLDQSRSALRGDLTLADALTGGAGDFVEINGERKHVVGYMRDFLFAPEQARTPVSRLSGGERARLVLARALSLPSNVLALDEPTNDLDMETLDLLQEMLADYRGAVIVVSHDRDFIDRIATTVLVSEGEGRWSEYAGGYSDMVAQRGSGPGARIAAPAARPPRAKVDHARDNRRPPSRRRLSFKEKHALETLPGRIRELTEAKAKLLRELEDPGLFARDPKHYETVSSDYERILGAISTAENQWLELEILREETEN